MFDSVNSDSLVLIVYFFIIMKFYLFIFNSLKIKQHCFFILEKKDFLI